MISALTDFVTATLFQQLFQLAVLHAVPSFCHYSIPRFRGIVKRFSKVFEKNFCESGSALMCQKKLISTAVNAAEKAACTLPDGAGGYSVVSGSS